MSLAQAVAFGALLGLAIAIACVVLALVVAI